MTADELERRANYRNGNLYNPHAFMCHSGCFWRCYHGETGCIPHPWLLGWTGCWRCKVRKWLRID